MTPTEQPQQRLLRGVALALIVTLTLITLLPWLTARGQQPPESPLPTPDVPPTPISLPQEVAPLVPVELPSLTGVVRDTLGNPLGGMRLMLYRRQIDQWELVRQSTTAATGEFRIPWLSAGIYRLAVEDPTRTYARTFYPNGNDIDAAVDIALAGGAPDALDVTLAAGSRITGTLQWPEGPTPFDTTLNLYVRTQAPIAIRFTPFDQVAGPVELRQWRWVASQTYTASLVSYAFEGLAAGSYRVCAESVSLRTTLRECYDNTAVPIYASDIVITAAQTISNINIWLGDGADLGIISGTVTISDGTPAAGVRAELLPVAADLSAQSMSYVAETNENGVYQITQIPAGRYTLQFIDPTGRYFLSSYRATPEETTPTVIEFAQRDARTIDGIVIPAGQIQGLVTLDGAISGLGGQVYAYRQTDLGQVGITGQVVAATGAFTVTGLADGAYWLQFQLPVPGQLFYGGASVEDAARITVTAGQVISNVVYDLLPVVAAQPTGAISGTVTVGGAPRADIRIEAYGFSPDCCTPPPPLAYTLTDAEGRYVLGGLPAGTYKLGFIDPNETLATVYSGDTVIFEQAAAVEIANSNTGASQFVGGVDATMVMGGAVARSVRRADDTPVVGVLVRIYQIAGEAGQYPLVASTLTDADGRYVFIRLAPNTYHVCIEAAGIEPSTCAGRGGHGAGVEVQVQAGALTSGVDVVEAP